MIMHAHKAVQDLKKTMLETVMCGPFEDVVCAQNLYRSTMLNIFLA